MLLRKGPPYSKGILKLSLLFTERSYAVSVSSNTTAKFFNMKYLVHMQFLSRNEGVVIKLLKCFQMASQLSYF